MLEQKLEAILFYKNEPQEIKKLAKILNVGEKEVREALGNLSRSLENRGICLIMTETEASLATSPEVKDLIETMAKEEMSAEIGKAGLETLAIVLYNGPVSRREIDYIRGVNSTFILRNLAMRGLVERVQDEKDQRTLKYKGSLQLLAHLGLTGVHELPEFENFKNELKL
jgi:segregation and condensation protein B